MNNHNRIRILIEGSFSKNTQKISYKRILLSFAKKSKTYYPKIYIVKALRNVNTRHGINFGMQDTHIWKTIIEKGKFYYAMKELDLISGKRRWIVYNDSDKVVSYKYSSFEEVDCA